MRARGFTLVECLIGLSLSFFVVCACLEFFGAAQKSYFRLKEKEEASQSALAALDKMSADILRAGEGLVLPVSLGLIEPVAESGGGLEIILLAPHVDYRGGADWTWGVFDRYFGDLPTPHTAASSAPFPPSDLPPAALRPTRSSARSRAASAVRSCEADARPVATGKNTLQSLAPDW